MKLFRDKFPLTHIDNDELIVIKETERTLITKYVDLGEITRYEFDEKMEHFLKERVKGVDFSCYKDHCKSLKTYNTILVISGEIIELYFALYERKMRINYQNKSGVILLKKDKLVIKNLLLEMEAFVKNHSDDRLRYLHCQFYHGDEAKKLLNEFY